MNKKIIFVWDWDDTLTTETSLNPLWKDPRIFRNLKKKYSSFKLQKPEDVWKVIDYGRTDDNLEIGYLEFIRRNTEDGTISRRIKENFGLPFARKLTNADLRHFGSKVPIAPGLPNFIINVTRYWQEKGVEIEHYIVSVGLKEIIKGSAIAKHFNGIFANEYTEYKGYIDGYRSIVDSYGGKTGALITIVKGGKDNFNKKMKYQEYMNSYENMIIIDDGWSARSMFQAAGKRGATCLVVYDPDSNESMAKAEQIVGRWADAALPRDYRKGSAFTKKVHETILRMLSKKRCTFKKMLLHMYVKGTLDDDPSTKRYVKQHISRCKECGGIATKLESSYK